MRAYVQQLLKGDASELSFDQIAHWFGERDYEVIRFDYSELLDGLLDRGLVKHPEETIVAGGVQTVRQALKRAGRDAPVVPGLPEILNPWIGRDFRTSTLGEFRQMARENPSLLPLHLKPLQHSKLFTGKIVRYESDLGQLGHVDGSAPVLVQDPVEFRSEWRTYILRGRIAHVARYLGDPLLFPDAERMSEALGAFAGQPVACGMDWGITSSGQTLLIEVNDGYALGNYGLPGMIHTAMIEARWRELMGLPDNGIGERL